MDISTYRRLLNSHQIELLELLYTFRFGTVRLIQEYCKKSSYGLVFNRLKVLEDQGLIAKRFDSSYRIQGKPAAYYLQPAGARALQATRDPEDEAVNIKSLYKDKTVSETFIEHSLRIFTVYNQLKAQYGKGLAFFTKVNYVQLEHFPRPLPDIFLTLETSEPGQDFFGEVVADNQPFFTAVRRVQKYFDHKESGDWALTDTAYPPILFICESTSLQKRLQKQIARMLRRSWVSGLAFATTTLDELARLSEHERVWQEVTEPEEKLALGSIS